jgi:hypothetical protein
MKPIFNLRTLGLSLIVVSTAVFLSACSSPTTSPSTTPVVQQPADNPIHVKGKDNRIQSVTYTVNNHSTQSFAERVYYGVNYSDIVVPASGTYYYTIGSHATSIVINGQTVNAGDPPTQVTLPNSAIITVSVIVIDTNEVN